MSLVDWMRGEVLWPTSRNRVVVVNGNRRNQSYYGKLPLQGEGGRLKAHHEGMRFSNKGGRALAEVSNIQATRDVQLLKRVSRQPRRPRHHRQRIF